MKTLILLVSLAFLGCVQKSRGPEISAGNSTTRYVTYINGVKVTCLDYSTHTYGINLRDCASEGLGSDRVEFKKIMGATNVLVTQ